MKKNLIAAILCLYIGNMDAKAQTIEQKITYSVQKEVPLQKLLEQISKQTKVSVTYTSEDIKDLQLKPFNFVNKSLSEISIYIEQQLPVKINVSANSFSVKRIYNSQQKPNVLTFNTNDSLNKESKIDEVVIVGYGKQSRSKVTGAVSKISGGKLMEVVTPSFDQALAARIPGVDIAQSNGAPGAASAIKIRGNTSINFGSQPLIVVDGVPLTNSSYDGQLQGRSSVSQFDNSYSINLLNSINSADIESIDVLKDAASAAIYGSRGSNGVILITTKLGKQGKAKVNFNMYKGVQILDKKVKVMDAYELANFTKRARDLAWVAVGGNADDPSSVRTGANYKYPDYMLPYINGEKGLINTDWQDEVYRTAMQDNFDVSVSGASKNIRYYVSGNYLNQDGIIINSGMKRFTSRVNLETDINDKVKLGVRLSPTFVNNNLVQSEANWWKEGIVITALMYHPNLAARNPDGGIRLNEMMDLVRNGNSVANIQNPVALAMMIDNTLITKQLTGNTFLEYKPNRDFTLKTIFGVESISMHRNFYRPKTMAFASEAAPTKNFNYGLDSRASIFNWISETNATYDKKIGLHDINVLAGFSVQKETNNVSLMEGRNFPNDLVKTLNVAASVTGSTVENESVILSMLSRVMYSYDNKYMLTASIRRDGSSRFAQNHKWGWFPSVSAGWNLHRESFFPSTNILKTLKIRSSYGMTGNANIPFYGGIPTLVSNNYVFGNQLSLGFSPFNAPNPNLSWESTATANLGIEAGLFKNKWQLNFDLYRSVTKDLLLNVEVPASSGMTSALQNIGKLENKGFEFSLSTTQKLGQDFTFDGTVMFAVNRNKVLELAPGQNQILYSSGLADASFIVKVGESLGSFYGYKTNGVFTSQQQFDSTPHLINVNQSVGDLIYMDISGDGKVDENDRTIIGNANPKFTWAFNGNFKYKALDFGFVVMGKQGQQIFNATHRYLAEAWGNNLSYWGQTDAPRPVWGVGSRTHTRPSSLHVEDGSFIRVRSLSLGYTFDKIIPGIENLRVYTTATNPFTFTKYSGYNPEVSNTGSAITAGEDFGNYPTAKTFILGFNISF
ncbi:MAG: TonB-dependent receptor [Cruoricaptor ignavus]|nr:TonB-dependent receptor [Cruoricaptor ignavus]